MAWRLLAAAAVVGLFAAVVAGVLVSRRTVSPSTRTSAGDRRAASVAPGSGDPPAGPTQPVRLSLGPPGRRIPAGFLGFSFEFSAVRDYTGSDPSHINPVLVALIRNLTPGQRPVLRIGGDSTDAAWVPAPGVRPPHYVSEPLGPSWLATTAALAHELNARMILGVNLVADEPRLAAAEADAYGRAFGPAAIDALEIGNEPNIYGKIRRLPTASGRSIRARPRHFGYPAYARQFARMAAAVPGPALAGPALAEGPTPGAGSWVHMIRSFLAVEPRVATLTLHRYPLRNCNVPPRSPQYPTIAHLLSPYAWHDLADSLRVWIRIARRAHRGLRDDEMNSVACRGRAGVSDTFASALWVVNALFSLAQVGVDGVNLHSLPGAAYRLFNFTHRSRRWQGQVSPIYYGLQLFAQAAPPGARLLDVRVGRGMPGVSEWATRAPDGTRVVLVNTGRAPARVEVTAPPHRPPIFVGRLTAPAVNARAGIQLDGFSYGASTSTGRFPRSFLVRGLSSRRGRVAISVAPFSAALVTFLHR